MKAKCHRNCVQLIPETPSDVSAIYLLNDLVKGSKKITFEVSTSEADVNGDLKIETSAQFTVVKKDAQ